MLVVAPSKCCVVFLQAVARVCQESYSGAVAGQPGGRGRAAQKGGKEDVCRWPAELKMAAANSILKLVGPLRNENSWWHKSCPKACPGWPFMR